LAGRFNLLLQTIEGIVNADDFGTSHGSRLVWSCGTAGSPPM
jgi:hypothetical protein